MLKELESLILKKGSLYVYGGINDGFGATIANKWPYCHGETLELVLQDVVRTHARLEREELQKRINEIDASASL